MQPLLPPRRQGLGHPKTFCWSFLRAGLSDALGCCLPTERVANNTAVMQPFLYACSCLPRVEGAVHRTLVAPHPPLAPRLPHLI